MLNERNSLFVLLSKFSDSEWNEFEKFVASPYFNNGRNYTALMKILRRNRPGFNSEELRKESLYRKLFPGKAYKESVMYSAFSRISKLAEEFLIQREMETDEKVNRERLKISAYARLGLMGKAQGHITKVEKELKESGFRIRTSFDLKEMAKEVASYYYLNDQRAKIPGYIHMILKYSLCWYLTEFSMFYVSLVSQKSYDSSGIADSLSSRLRSCVNFEEIIKLLGHEDTELANIMRLHYLSMKAREVPFEDAPYFETKELVFAMLGKMDKEYKQYWMNNLAETCSMRFVAGDSKFKKEAFAVRKRSVEEDLFSYNNDGTVRLSEFRSTFTEALNVNELEWAEEFSRRFVPRLNPAYRRDAEYYCGARIAYERKDMDKAVELSMKVRIDQVYYKLDIKNLLAKAYYDTDSVEPLLSLLNSYYQFIRNSGKSADVIFARHLNFVRYLRRLAVIKFEKKNKKEIPVLIKELENENVSAKSWLIKKIVELK